MKYIAKPGTWFDDGTEAELLDDPEDAYCKTVQAGLFRGYKDGKLDEEICEFDEFEIVEE